MLIDSEQKVNRMIKTTGNSVVYVNKLFIVFYLVFFFFFNDTATTEIYTLSLHDALPIFSVSDVVGGVGLSVSWAFTNGFTLACSSLRTSSIRPLNISDAKSKMYH